MAKFFDKDIWFVKNENTFLLKYLHSDENIIKELFYYFDLIDVKIFDLKEYYIMSAFFVKGSLQVIYSYIFSLTYFNFLTKRIF